MTALDVCAYLGLAAVGCATVTLWLGLLMALRYSPVRQWPRRRVNVFALHQWTAYLAVTFTVTHPLVLLWVKAPHFGWVDLVWPIHSPLLPKLNMAGAGALYLLVIVLGSSLLRGRIGRPLWRSLHYLVFPAAVLLFLHSVLTDPLLKDRRADLLDGGKIFVEAATVLSGVAVGVRVRLRGRGLRLAKYVTDLRTELQGCCSSALGVVWKMKMLPSGSVTEMEFFEGVMEMPRRLSVAAVCLRWSTWKRFGRGARGGGREARFSVGRLSGANSLLRYLLGDLFVDQWLSSEMIARSQGPSVILPPVW